MTRSRQLLLVPVIVAVVSAFAAQQTPVRDVAPRPPSTGTASIAGRVLNELSGQPVRRATVSLSNSDRNVRLTAGTDDAGRFLFAELPAGRYALSVAKPGFVTTNHGAPRPGRPGVPVVLDAGEQKTGLTVRVAPGAVIAGTVRSPDGTPIEGARVMVLRMAPSYTTGERQLQSAGVGGFGQATDDRGEYRVYGLAPGEYYVVTTTAIGSMRNATDLREITRSEIDWATRQLQAPGSAAAPPETGRAVDFVPVFYPASVTQAGAVPVVVKAGEERGGIDVTLDRVPTGKITGQVVRPGGDLPATLQINLIAHDTIPGIPFSGFGSARADASGRFVSAGLPPGDYSITVRVPPAQGGAGAGALFGFATVSLLGGDADVTVTLGTGVTVTGKLTFDGAAPKPDVTRMRVNLTAARGRTPTLGVPAAIPDAAGNFRFVGVTPGRYQLSAATTGGWFPKGSSIDGRDAMDRPVEIGAQDVSGAEVTFTDKQTEISGDLLDAKGQPAPEFHIIVFPASRDFWVPQSRRIQSARPANDGKFRFQNLPAGEYLIAAVTDVEPQEWFDPAFLEQLVGASTKILLAEGEKKVQGLRIKGRH
jgi:uncharacterized protein (DUF2141 family)/protocatechuate 3,4-dioxygenase beta subunit